MLIWGVMGSAVDTAEAKKLNLAQGVYVDDVNAVSPAFKGGCGQPMLSCVSAIMMFLHLQQ